MADAAKNGFGVKTPPTTFNDTYGNSGIDSRGTSATVTQDTDGQGKKNANGVEVLDHSKDDIG